MKRWLLLAVLLLPGASAHAQPYDSDPLPGERLDAPPAVVVVHFTEPVYEDGTFIEVHAATGGRVDLDDLHIEYGQRPTMTISVPDDLPDGGYLVRWQTYSQTDGHVVGGTIGFAIGGFTPPDSDTADAGDFSLVATGGRLLHTAGLALFFGALVFVAHAALGDLRPRIERVSIVAGLLSFTGILLLQADTATQTGRSLLDSLGGEAGHQALQRLIVSGGIVLLSAVWAVFRPRWSVPLLTIAWIVVVALGARVGHANIRGPSAIAVQSIHAVAMAAWIGGLVWLGRLLPKAAPGRSLDLGRRYASVAIWYVSAVAASGVLLSLMVLGSDVWRPGWLTTPWGGILLAKVCLAAAMVAIAAVNRYVFLATAHDARPVVDRLQSLCARIGWRPIEAKPDRDHFRSVVRAEASVGLVVLALAAVLMSLAAPATALEPIDEPFQVGGQGRDHTTLFEITPDPAAGGSHSVRMYIQVEGGGPVANNTCGRDDCILLSWWRDADGEVAAQRRDAVPVGDGWWEVDNVLFEAGNHTMRATIQTADVFLDEVDVAISVPQA